MSFPKYPAYKDSGVEWLGEVPAHWSVAPFKRCATIFNGKDHKDVETEDGDIPVIGSGGEFSRASNYLYDGESILLGRKGTIDKPLYVEGKFWTVDTMFYSVVSPPSNGRFLYYSALKIPFSMYSTNTALPSMTQESLSGHLMAIPPPDEQATVAAFLDHETGQIDALIEEQRRLIDLLKEKRQAVISHAVTKGLDPNVPMKDSGVEWLGEVPAHWEIVKFPRVVQIAEGQVDPKQDPYREMILVAPNHIESNTGRLVAQESAESQGAESGKYLCLPGDVVYSKIRPALRKASLVDMFCLCSADMYPLRVRHSLDNRFLLWTILSEPFSRFAIMESQRVAMPKINRESLNELRLLLPPLEEQAKISVQIDKEVEGIDELLQAGQSAVQILGERRSALISAAVTGKIDVRGWSAGVEVKEPELAMVAEEQAGYSAQGGTA